MRKRLGNQRRVASEKLFGGAHGFMWKLSSHQHVYSPATRVRPYRPTSFMIRIVHEIQPQPVENMSRENISPKRCYLPFFWRFIFDHQKGNILRND